MPIVLLLAEKWLNWSSAQVAIAGSSSSLEFVVTWHKKTILVQGRTRIQGVQRWTVGHLSSQTTSLVLHALYHLASCFQLSLIGFALRYSYHFSSTICCHLTRLLQKYYLHVRNMPDLFVKTLQIWEQTCHRTCLKLFRNPEITWNISSALSPSHHFQDVLAISLLVSYADFQSGWRDSSDSHRLHWNQHVQGLGFQPAESL